MKCSTVFFFKNRKTLILKKFDFQKPKNHQNFKVTRRYTRHSVQNDIMDHYEWYEDGLPWHGINDIDEQVHKQPTFVACEAIFIFIGLISFVHAVANGKRLALSLSLSHSLPHSRSLALFVYLFVEGGLAIP